jgi:hypothetical protein
MPQASAVKQETRELPMLSFRAAVQPSTFDAEKRTVEITWTTGAKGLRRSYWDGDYYEELEVTDAAVRMGRLNNGAPLLAAHEAYSLDSVIGVVERAWIQDGVGKALVRFSEREEVQGIVKDVQSGVLRNISVGYTVYRYEVDKGVDTKIDTYRAVDWEPMELSIVPIGFDDGAKVRSADGQKMRKVEIVTRGAAATDDKEDRHMPTEQETAAAGANLAANQQAVDSARAEGTQVERKRQTEIRDAVRKAGLVDTLAEKLVSDGVTIDAARATIIDAMAEKQNKEQTRTNGHHVEGGADASEKFREGAMNWLVRKAAIGQYFKNFDKMDPGEFRGMTLMDLARESLTMAGVQVRGLDKLALVGKALTYRSAYNGTNDFAVLLENTLHKTLLGAFATAPDTWRKWCAVGSVSDFRAHNRYRLGSFGTLDAVKEGGEFKNKQIPDGEKQSVSIGTKGNIIALSRQAIINDDMGAFNGLATSFGRMAGLSIESDAYALLNSNSGLGPNLSDGNPVFFARTVQGTNIGAGAALSIASLDLDRQVMASQKDISGNEYLDIRPQTLLVPLSLGGAARIYNNSQYDTDVSSKFQVPNKVAGLFSQIVDTPRLTGTRRWMFADPSIAPVYEVDFLDGQQEPFLDNEIGWRVDGTEWKVRLDYGVAAVGYQGGVTNAGV